MSCQRTCNDGDFAREIWYVIHRPSGVRREALLCDGEDATHSERTRRGRGEGWVRERNDNQSYMVALTPSNRHGSVTRLRDTFEEGEPYSPK